jgi:hypothetical protein
MEHATTQTYSFAALFDPEVARAAAARGAQWNLPRQMCRPLDRYVGPRVNADLAAFDAEVELAPLADEDLDEESNDSIIARARQGADFEDADEDL